MIECGMCCIDCICLSQCTLSLSVCVPVIVECVLIMDGVLNGHRLIAFVVVFRKRSCGGKVRAVPVVYGEDAGLRGAGAEMKRESGGEKGAHRGAAGCCLGTQFVLHLFMRLTAWCSKKAPGQHRAKGMGKMTFPLSLLCLV